VKELIMNKLSARQWLSALALSTALVSMTGCSSVGGSPSLGAYIDDSAITAKVKAKFAEAKDVDALAINVETINRTVLLKGVAKSPQEKLQAETLARSVEGVRGVNNRIDVRA
jgi:osmotically-inducible protein OsmY